MENLDKIFDLLDWNKSEAEQQRGRAQASQLKDLSMLIQPTTPQYNKNVWDNCALILSQKSDEELSPYFEPLLQWLQDLNWPGAFCIRKRLLLIKNPSFMAAVCSAVETATKNKEKIWLQNLSVLVKNDMLKQTMPTAVYQGLWNIYESLPL